MIVFAIIHYNDAKAAAAKRALTAVKPSVSATVAAATKGSIGIYLDAIGTVTPVYTASITAQASGVLTAVHYSEGQFVQKGAALIDIDPRPCQAQLMQAEGALEHDSNVLAQAQMDLDRDRTAWARNGINRQLLDDQEKIVLQDLGTVKNDQGAVNYDRVQLSYLRQSPHPLDCGASASTGIGWPAGAAFVRIPRQCTHRMEVRRYFQDDSSETIDPYRDCPGAIGIYRSWVLTYIAL